MSNSSISEKFYVLYQDVDTVVIYYCGKELPWNYDGVLVLRRFYNIDVDRKTEALKTLEKVGI